MAADLNLFVTLLLLGICSPFVSSDVLENPQILPEEKQHVVNAYNNLTLECQGNRPVEWNYTLVDQESNYNTRIDISPSNSTFKYASKIFIQNISFAYTGYFKCYFTDANHNIDEQHFAQTYVFVRDTDELSATTGDISKMTPQFGNLTIPCRPSFPDVNVEFRTMNNAKIPLNGNSLYQYNYYDGIFTTNASESNSDIVTYKCVYNYRNKTQHQNVYIRFEDPVDHVKEPILEDLSHGHTSLGEKLQLTCIVQTRNTIHIEWITPVGKFPLKRQSDYYYLHRRQQMVHLSNLDTDRIKSSTIQKQSLHIENPTKAHSGNYTCRVYDIHGNNNSAQIEVPIYDVNETFIKFYNAIETRKSVKIGENITWNVYIKAQPKVTFSWWDNNGEIIRKTNEDYQIDHTSNKASLTILNVNIDHFGNYTLKAHNTRTLNSIIFFLNVTSKPKLEIRKEPYQNLNEINTINCTAIGSPRPTISWSQAKCQNCTFKSIPENYSHINKRKHNLELTSFLNMNTTEPIRVRCSANNHFGNEETTTAFIITDVNNGFDITVLDTSIDYDQNKRRAIVARGSLFKITCGALISKYNNTIQWLHNNKVVNDGDLTSIVRNNTKFTNFVTLIVYEINANYNGTYSCKVHKKSGEFETKEINVSVTEPTRPIVKSSDLERDFTRKLPGSLEISCSASGFPKPRILWYKDQEQIHSNGRIQINENHTLRESTLNIQETEVSDEGSYQCRAISTAGTDLKAAKLTFSNKPKSQPSPLMICIIVFLALSATYAIGVIIVKNREDKPFGVGNVFNLNPKLTAQEQIHCLPYIKKWEICSKNLRTGIQLGNGNFGVVMLAEAKGIVPGEKITVVAVKKAKDNNDSQQMRALASELIIMSHLEKHVNVVNLLGAITKKHQKRGISMIVEFCPFGNIRDYLIKHRTNFVNQVISDTSIIDYSIVSKPIPKTTSGYHPYNIAQNENGPKLTTKDLLIWAFQVARGMEHLASQRILHSDLAARNILLSHGNVVKICDFGLAKNIYDRNYYKRTNKDEALPLMWMAIESIGYQMFSTKSDVWSFGIVLWEIFSLGQELYRGWSHGQMSYDKLKAGERMDSPHYAPKTIYEMMRVCWNNVPNERPTFTELVNSIGALLPECDRKHFTDLNDPYLEANRKATASGTINYLKRLRPPNADVVSNPQNQNLNCNNDDLELTPMIPNNNFTIDNSMTDSSQNPLYFR